MLKNVAALLVIPSVEDLTSDERFATPRKLGVPRFARNDN